MIESSQASEYNLPHARQLLKLSESYNEFNLKGIRISKDNPFEFKILASGETSAQQTTGDNIVIDDIAVNNQLYGILPADISKLDTTCEGEITTVSDN